MPLRLLALAALLPAAALAAADELPPRIVVIGTATVSTPPDRAIVQYQLHGEGATSDEAVRALAGRGRAIEAALGSRAEPRASQVSVSEVRGRDCMRGGYGPKLAVGDCAIQGYSADVGMELRLADVKAAATIVGLIARAGGTNPRIERFTLADDAAAQARAVAAALAQARAQAEAIAAAAKLPLGRILSIANGALFGQPLAAEDLAVTAVPAPPPPAPPVAITATPKPIETQARVTVVYAIGG